MGRKRIEGEREMRTEGGGGAERNWRERQRHRDTQRDRQRQRDTQRDRESK